MPEPLGYQFDRKLAAPIETYRQVNTITQRNAIPMGIRWEGMLCYVVSESQTYELNGGIDNANWIESGQTTTNPTTHFKGFFDATDLSPELSNANGIEGDEYKVINGGVNVNFGAGNVFLKTDDIIIYYGGEWMVKVTGVSGGTVKLPPMEATEGQTLITVPDDFISVDLTIGQAPQNEGIDQEYTYTPGTIVMTYPLREHDIINVRGYKQVGALPETPLEEEIYGTALYASISGASDLDITTFSSHYFSLSGNATHTLTGLPSIGKSIVKTLLVKSSTVETYAITNATKVIGEYVNDGNENRVTIEASNYPTVGLRIMVTFELFE